MEAGAFHGVLSLLYTGPNSLVAVASRTGMMAPHAGDGKDGTKSLVQRMRFTAPPISLYFKDLQMIARLL